MVEVEFTVPELLIDDWGVDGIGDIPCRATYEANFSGEPALSKIEVLVARRVYAPEGSRLEERWCEVAANGKPLARIIYAAALVEVALRKHREDVADAWADAKRSRREVAQERRWAFHGH